MTLPKKPKNQTSTLDDFIINSDKNIKIQKDEKIKIQRNDLVPATIQLSTDLRRRLRRAAVDLDMFQRDIVRDALTQYLNKLDI